MSARSRALFNLAGKISDRIRGGKLPKDVKVTKVERYEAPPSSKAVRRAEGHGQGDGATRRRSGPGAE